MVQDDDQILGGFSDLLADIEIDNNGEQHNAVVAFHKTQLADDKLLASVFESNEDDVIKKISDNNQPLVKNKLKNYHAGHRQRARERFMQTPSLTTDIELLELLLFTIIPRADTKQIAYALIDKFKNLHNLSNASTNELNACSVNGEKIHYAFKLCNEIVARILQNEIDQRSVLDTMPTLLRYCEVKIGTLAEEEFHVLFLDSKLRLIKDEKSGAENVNGVTLNIRRIMQKALELHACNIVLTHNHPSGDCTPSQTDIDTTNEIKQSLKSIGVKLLDHIVVSGGRCYCFSENYLLEDD
ncbi:MAG: DNA repair protein RadC [Rickettsiales bacterium]|nr:DNA repair protein RadC [Rickettsiales bacterium]